jgi:hypothetical protein
MSAHLKTVVAAAMLAVAGSFTVTAIAADAPAPADTAKLTTGLTPLEQLLELMDTDQSGRVSKAEFMKFMEAEFDFADKNKDGELDPTELKNLVYRMNHPYRRAPAIGK